ncbi:hypothetical protein [Soonwooa purpurea]
MKKCNFLFILLCSLASIMVEASRPAVQKRIDTSIHKTSFEITYEEWILFYDMMNLANGTEARNFVKNTDVKKYTASHPKEKIILTQEDADFLHQWLAKHQKDQNYLQQILQEIASASAPTAASMSPLCSELMTPAQDTSETSIGYNYQNELWKLAGAKPTIDPTEVGRVKVQCYWNKYKKDIRCPGQGLSDTDDLSVAKHAMDTSGIRFVRELAIAYKVDFNFIDEKDGLTVLDFVQGRIYMANRRTPKPEQTLIEYQAIYDAIVRAGGKHSENWLKKRDTYK